MFLYECDYGDGSTHESSQQFVVCLDGDNASPPDDGEGPWGYAHLLEVADPGDTKHAQATAWAGGPIDPRRST